VTATPVPRRLYIYDDFSEELRTHGDDSRVQRLGQTLLGLFRQDPRVVLLTLEEQIEALIARAAHAPFTVAIGVGRAGARVAAEIHARTAWFPTIERVDVWREEDGAGGYALAGSAPLASQLGAVADADSVAVVDDTIFSGLTMRAVLTALPPRPARRVHAFCLRGVAESVEAVARLVPVTAGVLAQGRILEDVSFINASGLVHRGAIRRARRPPLAFFERPEWMAAWFPGYADDAIALCRQIHEAVEAPPGGRAPRRRRGSPTPSAPPGPRRPGSSARR
jgi:adenine/guanine phosphoribosyltransferase-like PRPP-binding protein